MVSIVSKFFEPAYQPQESIYEIKTLKFRENLIAANRVTLIIFHYHGGYDKNDKEAGLKVLAQKYGKFGKVAIAREKYEEKLGRYPDLDPNENIILSDKPREEDRLVLFYNGKPYKKYNMTIVMSSGIVNLASHLLKELEKLPLTNFQLFKSFFDSKYDFLFLCIISLGLYYFLIYFYSLCNFVVGKFQLHSDNI